MRTDLFEILKMLNDTWLEKLDNESKRYIELSLLERKHNGIFIYLTIVLSYHLVFLFFFICLFTYITFQVYFLTNAR